MSLKAEDVRSVFKNKGFAWAALSVMSTIVLGVTDQFTSRIVPSVADAIESYFHPPRFFITFVPPTDLSEGLAVSALGAEAATEVKTNRVGARGVAALAGTGVYEVRLRRKREQTLQELVDTKAIEKRDQIWQVDTSERNWADASDLKSGGESEPASGGGGTRLSGTRWSTAEPDFAILASVDDPILRSALANALAEVGVYERGSEREKLRIRSYWAAAGPRWSDQSPDFLLKMPWSGAFVGWVYGQAGAEAPQGSAAHQSWRAWGDEVAFKAIRPGMAAVFGLGDSAKVKAGRRLLVGVVLRRQPDCVEVVAGNVAERVVITCVIASSLVGIRKPNLLRMPAGGTGDSEQGVQHVE